MQGTLYIISSPSGGGKTSLVNALLAVAPNLRLSISHTTRAPRAGEKHGENYFFVDKSTFETMQQQQHFLESALVFGHAYGTSRVWVEEELAKGTDVLLEIDWQGARQIKQNFPHAIGIYILPPSLSVLEQRLRNRGQDDDSVIEKRMRQATTEISHCDEYDYIIVNESFDQAAAELQAIISAERLKSKRQLESHSRLLQDLLV